MSDLEKHTTEWLLQFLYAIRNGAETEINLYTTRTNPDPRQRAVLITVYDEIRVPDGKTFIKKKINRRKVFDQTIRQPSGVGGPWIPGYVTYIPPNSALGFFGLRLYLGKPTYNTVVKRLAAKEPAAWVEFMGAESIPPSLYREVEGALLPTPHLRERPNLERLARYCAEVFEPFLEEAVVL